MLTTFFRVSSLLCVFALLPLNSIVSQEKGAPVATVTLLGGKSINGRIQKLDQGSVTISPANATSDQGEQFAIEDVERIEFESNVTNVDPPHQLVRLVDGSLLAADDFTIADRTASVSLVNGKSPLPIRIATRDIDWLRLQMSRSLDNAWTDATKSPPGSDTLFLLKDGELQTLEGVIQAVNDQTLDFKLDGDVIRAKRTRISGMSFYHAAGRELPAPLALCRNRFGSQMMIRSLRFEHARQDQSAIVKLDLVSGSELSLPASSLSSLDFTIGKILYISDLPVDAQQWSPQIDAGPLQKPLGKLLTWSKDRNLNGKPLKLYSARGFSGEHDSYTRHEKEFPRGISLRSGTKLVYLIPAGYQRLTAVCGIDPLVRPQGNVILEFSSDGESLWSREISGDADSPESIDFEIQDVKRLVLHVDYGKHSDVADHLNICNLRLIK